MLEKFFENKKNVKETKIKTKEHNNRQNVNICVRNWDTNRDRKQLNISESVEKNFRLSTDNEKENWRILTNKEIYASVKNQL